MQDSSHDIFARELSLEPLLVSSLEEQSFYTGWLLFGYLVTGWLANDHVLGHLPSGQSASVEYIEISRHKILPEVSYSWLLAIKQ